MGSLFDARASRLRTTAIVAVAAAIALSGCGAAQTRLVTNEKISDTVRAKSFKTYHEVWLLPPKDDSRKVVPRVVHDIESYGFKVRVLDPGKPLEPPQGTGFVVGGAGYVLTCAHVVGEQKEATVTLAGQRLVADVVKADAKIDLALLKVRDPLPPDTAPLVFREAAKPAALGEEVSTLGYPLSRILGNSVRMTRGLLSATVGLRDDDRQVQVSAEIQPGSSGGPLLDHDGKVIGIVASTISPAAVAQSTGGSLPQNVNFAVKAAPALDFLKGADPALYAGLRFDKAPGFANVDKAVAKIQAGIAPADSERVDKMVVRLAYVSHVEFWYRFRLFVLAAFDYQTQEPLFVAGQDHETDASEDAVIRDTMLQFGKAVSAR